MRLFLLALIALLLAPAGQAQRSSAPPVSFVDDVVPTLARLGCSQGSCHGAAQGKGGFRLSLRGYAPELDFVAITRHLQGRRITREAPERSLLLRKPLGEVAHRGGLRLKKGSPEHTLLLHWIRQGTPGPTGAESPLARLEITPPLRTMRPGQRLPLRVQATYENGRTEDVTYRALFWANDPAIATVDEAGIATQARPGETAIIARYRDRVATARLSCPYPQSVPAGAFLLRHNRIDDLVHAQLKRQNVAPSPLCDDATFLRRAYLDAIGTLPTEDEARAFLADRHPDRRARLIDTLLERPEFGAVWALKLGDLLLLRKEYMHRKYAVKFQAWLTEQFNANRPWNALVTDLLTATGDLSENPAGLFWVSRVPQKEGQNFWVRGTEASAEMAAQVFLGARLQCAKCHNHPTERYTQDDYYRFAGLFRQLSGAGESDDGVPQKLEARDASLLIHPRLGKALDPCCLDRAPLTFAKDEDRRARAATWLVKQDDFARNIANRLWARCFGIGIVEPVDDLRSTNPPRNEPLMNFLASELRRTNFDLKALLRLMLTSATYQRSSVPVAANRLDGRQFARYYPRRLPAEELADAIAQVSEAPDRYAGMPPGARAIEVADTEIPSVLLDTFGRPPRVQPADGERNCDPAMGQALALLNSTALQEKLKHPDGLLARLTKAGKSDPEIVESLFLRALSRFPQPAEKSALLALVGAAKSRDEALQDALWALLNSDAFLFNH